MYGWLAMLRRLKQPNAPLYRQVADLMRKRIKDSDWPPGFQLPTLQVLVREFGVARLTVIQAMDILAAEGVVTRRQGRGTFVLRRPADQRWLRVHTSLDEFSAVYGGAEPRMLADGAKMPVLREAEGRLGPAYRFLRRVNSRDGVPFGVISIFLDEAIFCREPARFRNEAIIPILLTMTDVPIAHAWQELTIGTADVELAELLDIPVNSPTAEVRRIVRGEDGTVLYLGEISYRGDFVRLEIDLKR
ncbi:MAG: GntR family transcriptional regulator [Vulcanimicrobiaceae bacterium]